MLLGGLMLAGGFVFAAGQHFSALRFGYQQEKLRAERSRLLDQQQRLLLEREVAATPARLESAARGLGMHPVQSAQIDPAKRMKRTLAAAAPANDVALVGIARFDDRGVFVAAERAAHLGSGF